MIVVRCDIETILKSLDSHLDWFHKRSFPSNFRDRISWGFNAEVVGLGLVIAIMVRNSEFLRVAAGCFFFHAWLLHMEYSELFKICGGWGLECYGRHGRWSKMLIFRAACACWNCCSFYQSSGVFLDTFVDADRQRLKRRTLMKLMWDEIAAVRGPRVPCDILSWGKDIQLQE